MAGQEELAAPTLSMLPRLMRAACIILAALHVWIPDMACASQLAAKGLTLTSLSHYNVGPLQCTCCLSACSQQQVMAMPSDHSPVKDASKAARSLSPRSIAWCSSCPWYGCCIKPSLGSDASRWADSTPPNRRMFASNTLTFRSMSKDTCSKQSKHTSERGQLVRPQQVQLCVSKWTLH